MANRGAAEGAWLCATHLSWDQAVPAATLHSGTALCASCTKSAQESARATRMRLQEQLRDARTALGRP